MGRSAPDAAIVVQRLEARRLLTLIGPDLSFGDNGIAQAGNRLILPLDSGKIITLFDDAGEGITRLNDNGTPDKTFGDGGTVTFNQFSEGSELQDVVVSGPHIIINVAEP